MHKFITYILLLITCNIYAQNKIIVRIDTSAKIQMLSTTGNRGNVGISGGNTVTVNVNDDDSVKTNELITSFSKSGNQISIIEQGIDRTINISPIEPTSGQVLKWDGSNWTAGTDLAGTGGGGSTYTSGSGINVNNTTFVISNTRELQKSGNTINLTNGGGSINISSTTPSDGQVLKWNQGLLRWESATDLTGSGGGSGTVTSVAVASGGGLTVSGSPITTSGTITITANDQSATNEIQTISKSGNIVTLSNTVGASNTSFAISNTNPEPGQVLKWSGSSWYSDTDLTGSGGGGGTLQTLGTNGTPGNISISDGNTININVDDADASTTNEKSRIGVSFVSGGGKLMNHDDGFANGNGTNLVINGATSSVVSSTNGGSITWTLPDASVSNELQNLSFDPKSGSTIPLVISSGSGVNLVNGTGVNISRDASNQATFSLTNTGVTAGSYVNSNITVDAQGRITSASSGTAGTGTVTSVGIINGGGISVSGSPITTSGNITITAVDQSTSNETITAFSKSGNQISITEAGTTRNISISPVEPVNGQALKWNGTQWTAQDDAVGSGGGGGATYTGGTGISVDNVAYTITNTGDLSNSNEVDVLRVSGSVSGGGKLQNVTNGFNQASEINLVINGATSSVTTGINGGITWTLPADQTGITTLNSQTGLSQSFAYGTSGTYPSWSSASNVHTFRLPSATSGQVLKFDGTGWAAGTDNNSGGTVTSVAVTGTGITVSGSPITSSGTISLTAADQSPTNEAQTIGKSGNLVTLSNVGAVTGGTFQFSDDIPNTNEVLSWNGSSWIAVPDNNTTYSAGTGLELIGTTFNNTGDLSTSNEGIMSLSGTSSPYTYNSNTSGSTPLTIAQGSGISITRSSNTLNVINTGDLSATNEAQTLSAGTNQINLNAISGIGGGTVNLRTINGSTILGSGDIFININDADANPSNEIQSLSTSDNSLSISSGNTVTVPNLYTANGSIPASTNRIVDLNSSSYLLFGKYNVANYPFVEMSQTTGLQIGYGSSSYHAFGTNTQTLSSSNSQIVLNNSGLRLAINGSNGSNGQVLTSNGTYASWQTPTQTYDVLYQESGPSISSWSNNADGSVFSTPNTTSNITSPSSTTFRKGASSQMYSVTLVLRSTSMPGQGTNGKEGGHITIGLYRGSTLVGSYGNYNVVGSGDEQHDLTFTFLTDISGTDYTFRNISGSSIQAIIKRIIINRIR